jgi:hypothetical protein
MDVINANREAVKSAPKLSAPNEAGKSATAKEFTKKPTPKGPAKTSGGAHKNKSPKRVEQKPQIVEKVKFNNGKKK